MMNGNLPVPEAEICVLKVSGALLVFFAGWGMGNWRSRQYQQRIKDLQILQLIISCLIGEISYARNTLPEAFSRISEKVASPLSGISAICCETAERADRRNLCTDPERAGADGAGKTSLREEDWDLFLQTLGHLGYLDAKMQIQLLESGKTELAMREAKLRHQLPEQKRVWQSLGILGGAFLVVILI